MKKLVLFIAAVLIFTSAVGISKNIATNTKNVSQTAEDEIASGMGIVLISRYSNYAWEPTDKGFFVDHRGYKYEFDLSKNQTSDFEGELMKIYDTKRPNGRFADEQTMIEIAKYAEAIAPDAEITKKYAACDAGQRTVYVNTQNNGILTVCSSGDTVMENTDSNARKIRKLCNKLDLDIEMW